MTTCRPFFFPRTIPRTQIRTPHGLGRNRLQAIFFRTLSRTQIRAPNDIGEIPCRLFFAPFPARFPAPPLALKFVGAPNPLILGMPTLIGMIPVGFFACPVKGIARRRVLQGIEFLARPEHEFVDRKILLTLAKVPAIASALAHGG